MLLVGLLPRGGDTGTPGTRGFHRSSWWTDDWNNHFGSIRAINEGLRDFAQAHRWVTYLQTVDAKSPFFRSADDPALQGLSDEPVGPRYIPTDVMYDLLHLSPRGYELFAEILLAALTPMLDGEAIAGGTHRTHANRSVRDGLPGARCIGRSCRGPELDLA